MSYILVLCTAEDQKQGKQIAKELVRKGLAACVNVIPKISSVYRWEDRLIEDDEAIMLIKTKSELFEKVKDKIIDLHTYDLPEIISLEINDANETYLNWIDKETLKL